MGIHTGKAELQDGGDYNGYLTFSRVQRLMSAGHGGQTLISLATQQLVHDELPVNMSLHDMGEHRLKDLIHPERIFQVNTPDLPSTFPALKTLDAQLNNLPSQLTPFVGRVREIAAVIGLLRNPNVHLVTLTGPGGTGKTRLSLQVAAELLDEFEHGVWFIELASITDPELVLPTIASTLKVKETADISIEQALQNHLHNRHLLLVLDNFEQVVTSAPKISHLLNPASKIKVLVSSREVLHLRGEHDYPVPPLGLPESKRKQTAAVLAQYEAIALFVQHAQAANPSFVLDEDNASIVADICSRLDGLPLALELAAARSRMLKPGLMLEKLQKSLDTLTGGARDLPRRQQTIRGAIDWSYNLLDESEKVLFTRLGIFIGGWTLDSAEAVCGSGLNVEVLNGIESLLDKSLICQMKGRTGEMRFTMLETIREYALEKLTNSGELFAIKQVLANYMEQFLQKIIAVLNGPEEVTWFAKLDDDLDNLRTVMAWALAHQHPAYVFTAGSLFDYWAQRANYREPLVWLERGLALDYFGESSIRARALNIAGNFLVALEEKQLAREYYEAALVLYRELDDSNRIAVIFNNLANIARAEKDYAKARQLYEDALAAGRAPNTWGHSMVLNNLGSMAKIRGDWQASRNYYLQSLKICEQLGADAGVSYAHGFLGILALAQWELSKAKSHFEIYVNASWVRATPLFSEIMGCFPGYVDLLLGNKVEAKRMLNRSIEAIVECINQGQTANVLPDGWMVIEGKARMELIDERPERAAQLFGAAWTQRERDDCLLTEFERPNYEARIEEVRSALGDTAFNATFQKGQVMSLIDALVFAAET